MKLLILTPEYVGSGGGIMTFYQSLSEALCVHGVTVRVLQGSPFLSGDRDAHVLNGVHLETLEARRLDSWVAQLPQLAMMPALRRSLAAAFAMWEQACESGAPDVVEATDFGFLSLPPIMAGRCPVVNQMHASAGQIAIRDPIRGQELEGVLSLCLDTAIVERAAAAQSYSLANSGYWTHQTGRDVECIRPAWKASAPPSTKQNPTRLVVIGRVQHWKGPHVLCEALRLLGPNCPQVDWYGRDTAYGEVGLTTGRWLANTYPDIWGKRITHHPTVPSSLVPAIQASALLNIVPSTWDVFNFTAVEAMASGRPIICSNGAGASELVRNTESGFVYEAESPAALAGAIESALALTHARQIEMGHAAQETIRRVLDPAVIAPLRIEGYERATGSTQLARSLPEWLVKLAEHTNAKSSPLAFLDHLPLKPLAQYAANRALRKITSR